MMILDDFVCVVEDCPEFNKPVEEYYDNKAYNVFFCKHCKTAMRKKLPAPKPHVSWSTWRI